MKKLMFAAVAAAVTTGAFAAPLVYDYKASAKHMSAKAVNVKWNNTTWTVYKKYVKSASLKGYLIVDTDGATSQTIIADTIAAKDPAGTRWANATPGTSLVDHGRSRAYLVVMNTKAEKDVRAPKLIPAVLDAKWIDGKFSMDANGNHNRAASGLAEGYLYAGGDFGVATRNKLDLLDAGVTTRGTTVNGQVMIGDYAWQSLWLFGEWNMPLVASRNGAAVGFWDVVQGTIDTGIDGANLPLTNAFAAGKPFFHDAWLNGAGFGKYRFASQSDRFCCGYTESSEAIVLQSLSGNLKGGLFLCTENGVVEQAAGYGFLGNVAAWEDQFFCARLTPAVDYAGDFDQTDLWQDGQLEMNTTDCVSGSWSIKLNTRDIAAALTREDLNQGLGLTVGTVWSEDAPGLTELLSTIKGAAQRLDRGVLFANGRNIYDYTLRELARHNEVPVPFITPAFAAYYGFLNFK